MMPRMQAATTKPARLTASWMLASRRRAVTSQARCESLNHPRAAQLFNGVCVVPDLLEYACRVLADYRRRHGHLRRRGAHPYRTADEPHITHFRVRYLDH